MDIIAIEDKIVCLKRDDAETKEQFSERHWLVINNFDRYKSNIDKLICLTKIWRNIKYLKCVYSDDIMREAESLILFNKNDKNRF
jgi:hypothetical protein